MPADVSPGPVKSNVLPSFLGPLATERENAAMGTQAPQLTSPGLQGLTTSILGSMISGLQKPSDNRSDNGPHLANVSRTIKFNIQHLPMLVKI